MLAAARQQGGAGQEGGRTGGGAMLLSIAGSSHNTFAGGVVGGDSTFLCRLQAAHARHRGAVHHGCCCGFGCFQKPVAHPDAAVLLLLACRQAGRQVGGQAGGRVGAGMPEARGAAHLPPDFPGMHPLPADFLPLFGQKTGWLLERLGLSARLDPVLGIHLSCTALLHFLRQGSWVGRGGCGCGGELSYTKCWAKRLLLWELTGVALG